MTQPNCQVDRVILNTAFSGIYKQLSSRRIRLSVEKRNVNRLFIQTMARATMRKTNAQMKKNPNREFTFEVSALFTISDKCLILPYWNKDRVLGAVTGD